MNIDKKIKLYRNERYKNELTESEKKDIGKRKTKNIFIKPSLFFQDLIVKYIISFIPTHVRPKRILGFKTLTLRMCCTIMGVFVWD